MVLEHAARPLDRGHICYSLAFTDNADPFEHAGVELGSGAQRIDHSRFRSRGSSSEKG
jgi:hypothetical protein